MSKAGDDVVRALNAYGDSGQERTAFLIELLAGVTVLYGWELEVMSDFAAAMVAARERMAMEGAKGGLQ